MFLHEESALHLQNTEHASLVVAHLQRAVEQGESVLQPHFINCSTCSRARALSRGSMIGTY